MNKGQIAVVGGIVGITALIVTASTPIPGDEIGVAVLLAIGALALIGMGGGHFELYDIVEIDA